MYGRSNMTIIMIISKVNAHLRASSSSVETLFQLHDQFQNPIKVRNLPENHLGHRPVILFEICAHTVMRYKGKGPGSRRGEIEIGAIED